MSDFLLLENGDELGLEDGSGSLLLESPPVNSNEKQFYGPLWPLPTLTLSAAVGVAITSGLSEALQTSEYFECVARGVILSAPSANLGIIYVVWRDGEDFTVANGVAVVLEPGSCRFIPMADYGSNRFKLSDIGVVAINTGDVVYAVGIMQ